MKNFKLIIILGILFSMGFVAKSQTLNSYLKAAESSFEEKDYHSALKYYMSANQFDEENTDILYKSAESARLFNAFTLSEGKYENVIQKEAENKYPLINFWLGDIKHRLGKYNEAIDQYKLYLSQHQGDDDYYDKRAAKEIEACTWANEQIFNPSENITITRLDDNINSSYSDFSGMDYKEDFIFSSMRFQKEKDVYYPGRSLAKILKQGKEGCQSLDSIFNNNSLLDQHLCFNTKGNKAYFTSCDYVGKLKIRCDIYSVDVSSDGKYSNLTKLPDFINDPQATNTQPNIGFDQQLKKEVLYFVSDREGGKGKFDIWYSILDNNGNFTKPINLADLNTGQDEITPFYHSKSNTLYFSSNGYLGMGGYDIYSSYNGKTQFTKPVHQGFPLNSSYDDIFYWLNEVGEKAYFSSNRAGTLPIDSETEACCFDIFKADYKPIKIDLLVNTFNKKTGEALNGSQVILYDATTDEAIRKCLSPETNHCNFELTNGKEYYLIASKVGYLPDTTKFNTIGITRSDTIRKNMYLSPMELRLEAFIFDKITTSDIKGALITLEDITDNTIRPITLLNENGNDFNFDLIRGHQYKITASKKGYEQVSEIVNTVDFNGSVIKKNIYMADKLNAYLPLVVYFDNDRPDPRSKSKLTTAKYSDIYNQYMLRKSDFIKKYTDGIADPNEDIIGKQELETFFDKDVKEGKEKFDQFLGTLLPVLEAGHKVNIQFKGFASPRADYEYNLILANRRVKSLDNDIRAYKNGALLKYIKNGKLKIVDYSYGESLAPPEVNSDITNEKLSIYSVPASKERRVEVIKISSDLTSDDNK